jgi:hypothetical protein
MGALSSVSTSDMKAVRAEVQNELQILAAKAPAPATPAPEMSTSSLRTSDIEDLNKAGKIAKDFMAGMDRIADVLMLLVMKFGRASTMMRGVFIGMGVAVALLAGNLFALWHISTKQTEIQEDQEKIQKQQAQILDRQSATQKVAGEAKQQAQEAAQKAQNAPEVGVDAKGRFILKVQDPGSPGETQVIRLPTQTPQR